MNPPPGRTTRAGPAQAKPAQAKPAQAEPARTEPAWQGSTPGPAQGTATRVLVVWCPDWPVTAVGLDAAVPGAVVTGERVVACTAAARASGVRRGQRIRDAQRHCPELAVHDRDPDAEGRSFETVAAAVATLTPRVEIVRPGVCAVPARGAARFHGGEESFRVLVQDTVVEAGFDCGVGIADGLFAAGLAARAGSGAESGAAGHVPGTGNEGGIVVPAGTVAGFLSPYPLAVLDRPELADLLIRLGVRTLGEFAALPAGDVAARFGADGALAHRLATGHEPRPLAPRPPASDPALETEFDPPADRSDEVIFAAKRLAGLIHEDLAAVGLTCVRLAVEVEFDDGRTSERLWRHDGELSALAVAERVRWQLTGWRPRAEEEGVQGGGVVLLRLVPDQLVPAEGRQQALWGQVTVSGRIARAADRIQAMLGHYAITRPMLVGARGPGERVVRVPVGDVPPEAGPDGPWPGTVPAPAPALVPPEAPPARVTDADGAPVRVSARSTVSAAPAQVTVAGGRPVRVASWTGPWPAIEHWWDPSRARRRARFQVVTGDGRAYLLALEGGRWHVEAIYD